MKLHAIIIKADDLTAADVREILSAYLPPASEPNLLPPIAAPAALPAAESGPRPPATPTRLASLPAGSNGFSARRMRQEPSGRAANGKPTGTVERPTTVRMRQCSKCGHTPATPVHHRTKCEKCSATAWETIPGRRDLTD